MARRSGTIQQRKFIKGLITEASEIEFPDDACSETWNCVFDDKGVVSRRQGYEYENNHSILTENSTSGVKKEFIWKYAGSSGTNLLVVLQEGHLISFFLPDSVGNISSNRKAFTVNLVTYKAGTATQTEIQDISADFAYGKGRLFISHPKCEPLYVIYNEITDTISVTSYEIEIRDMGGIASDGTTRIDQRPSTLTDSHKYNLFNQGWYISVKCGTGNEGGDLDSAGIQNVLTFWDTKRSNFPSNADIWYLYKDSRSQFNSDRIDSRAIGNSPAPKGHYIDNAFFFDRSAVSGIAGLTVETSENQRPSAVAFYAGRVWYGGVNNYNYTGKLYYSQVIEEDSQIGKCYQKNDPTSEDFSDLLATDGGVVDILEANQIVKLVPIQNNLFVFCTNGIWIVTGSQGTGFVANDYSVEKISSVATLSAYSFVLVEGTPMWFTNDGIYTMIQNDKGGWIVQSLTEETIKSFYQDIISANLYYAKGAYSPQEKVVQWLFRSDDAATISESFEYDRILNYNVVSNVFYPWTIPASDTADYPKVQGILALDTVGAFTEDSQVITLTSDTVINAALDNVVISGGVVGAELVPKFYYLVTGTLSGGANKLSWAQENNTQYLDWQTDFSSTLDYDSYFHTGSQIHAEGDKNFNSEYITIFSQTVQDSGFYVQGRWDFSNSGDSGKWSSKQQGYSTRRWNRDVTRRRLLIRGSGPALKLAFSSDANKPFFILGWTSWETADERT